MGRILDAFLKDQLRVEDGTQPQTSEYRKLSDKGYVLQNRLAEKLDEEGKEILTELVDTLYDESSVESHQKLERGFRLGVLMMAEVYSEVSMFL